MVAAVRAALAERGHPVADDPARITRAILDSLAARYADVVDTVERLTGAAIPGIHIVGGGSLNAYLNQATANAARRTVKAGPVEAAVLGNLLMQSMTARSVGSIEEGRAIIARASRIRRFEPSADPVGARDRR